MFTGIIEALGKVETWKDHHLSVQTPWNSAEFSLGQSIAIQGCCLTVTKIENDILHFDVSDETIQKTNFSNLVPGQSVNLERGMGMGSRFDGHWVLGHVDVYAKVIDIKNTSDQNSPVFRFGGLQDDRIHIVPKGSITVNGVSLTVNEVFEDGFSVSIVPHTMTHTNFSSLKMNDTVNIEFDMIGKYVLKYLENYQSMMRKS